jgi:hypothetical protein
MKLLLLFTFLLAVSLNSFGETQPITLDITSESQLLCDEYTFERPHNIRASIVIKTSNGSYSSNDLAVSECGKDLIELQHQIPFKVKVNAELTTSINRWGNTTTRTEHRRFNYGGFEFHASEVISSYTDRSPDHCTHPRCGRKTE